MANGYPCPSCGDNDADLFNVGDLPEGYDSAHAATSCAYACEACINAAGVTKGTPVIFSTGDLTSTSHQ